MGWPESSSKPCGRRQWPSHNWGKTANLGGRQSLSSIFQRIFAQMCHLCFQIEWGKPRIKLKSIKEKLHGLLANKRKSHVQGSYQIGPVNWYQTTISFPISHHYSVSSPEKKMARQKFFKSLPYLPGYKLTKFHKIGGNPTLQFFLFAIFCRHPLKCLFPAA